MESQKIHIIKLEKGQYLNDIEPFKSTGIPTNCILHKTVTGCGITTSELKHTKRNSIIILPNVPVIEGKVKAHHAKCKESEKILGIYKGIEVAHIKEYLESTAEYKKILTTPEGFNSKIAEVFQGDLQILLDDYFLLFDECDRLVKDIDYREMIAAPIDLFFQFKNKALVSATVLEFSDERFNDFDHYIVEPQYDYSKAIKLVETNNVLQSFKKLRDELKGQPVSIFLNSTATILSIIKCAGIENESLVFCADESIRKLRSLNFNRASSHLHDVEFATYNFFTSRFFSAVDIIVEHQPHVVLITDIHFAPKTGLDPFTDVIQIAGRYRNGISSLTHISNFNAKMALRTPEQAKAFLQGSFALYDGMLDIYSQEKDEGRQEGMRNLITKCEAHPYYVDGRRNSFMVDNFLHDERVKTYYQRFENLLSAYKLLPKHFVTTHTQDPYAIGDFEMLKKQGLKGQALFEEVIDQIHELTPRLDNFQIDFMDYLAYLRKTHPLWAKGYDLFGKDGVKKIGRTKNVLTNAINQAEDNRKLEKMSSVVYAGFGDKTKIVDESIPKLLQPIFDKFEYQHRATKSDIKLFYEAKRSTQAGDHVFKLGAKKFGAL